MTQTGNVVRLNSPAKNRVGEYRKINGGTSMYVAW